MTEMEWIPNNKEWIFSGIGVALISDGRRGVRVELATEDVVSLLDTTPADICS